MTIRISEQELSDLDPNTYSRLECDCESPTPTEWRVGDRPEPANRIVITFTVTPYLRLPGNT